MLIALTALSLARWRAAPRATRQDFRFRADPKLFLSCLKMQARGLSSFGEEWDDARAQFTANARKRRYFERIFCLSLGKFW